MGLGAVALYHTLPHMRLPHLHLLDLSTIALSAIALDEKVENSASFVKVKEASPKAPMSPESVPFAMVEDKNQEDSVSFVRELACNVETIHMHMCILLH